MPSSPPPPLESHNTGTCACRKASERTCGRHVGVDTGEHTSGGSRRVSGRQARSTTRAKAIARHVRCPNRLQCRVGVLLDRENIAQRVHGRPGCLHTHARAMPCDGTGEPGEFSSFPGPATYQYQGTTLGKTRDQPGRRSRHMHCPTCISRRLKKFEERKDMVGVRRQEHAAAHRCVSFIYDRGVCTRLVFGWRAEPRTGA